MKMRSTVDSISKKQRVRELSNDELELVVGGENYGDNSPADGGMGGSDGGGNSGGSGGTDYAGICEVGDPRCSNTQSDDTSNSSNCAGGCGDPGSGPGPGGCGAGDTCG